MEGRNLYGAQPGARRGRLDRNGRAQRFDVISRRREQTLTLRRTQTEALVRVIEMFRKCVKISKHFIRI